MRPNFWQITPTFSVGPRVGLSQIKRTVKCNAGATYYFGSDGEVTVSYFYDVIQMLPTVRAYWMEWLEHFWILLSAPNFAASAIVHKTISNRGLSTTENFALPYQGTSLPFPICEDGVHVLFVYPDPYAQLRHFTLNEEYDSMH